jgi:hypothetical protein
VEFQNTRTAFPSEVSLKYVKTVVMVSNGLSYQGLFKDIFKNGYSTRIRVKLSDIHED